MNSEVYEFMTMNSWFQIYEFIYYEFIGHYEFIVYEFIVYEFIAMNSYTSEFIYEFILVNDPDVPNGIKAGILRRGKTENRRAFVLEQLPVSFRKR